MAPELLLVVHLRVPAPRNSSVRAGVQVRPREKFTPYKYYARHMCRAVICVAGEVHAVIPPL